MYADWPRALLETMGWKLFGESIVIFLGTCDFKKYFLIFYKIAGKHGYAIRKSVKIQEY